VQGDDRDRFLGRQRQRRDRDKPEEEAAPLRVEGLPDREKARDRDEEPRAGQPEDDRAASPSPTKPSAGTASEARRGDGIVCCSAAILDTTGVPDPFKPGQPGRKMSGSILG